MDMAARNLANPSFDEMLDETRVRHGLEDDEWIFDGEIARRFVAQHYDCHHQMHEIRVVEYPEEPTKVLCFLRARNKSVGGEELNRIRKTFSDSIVQTAEV